jgi:hypothetical protein
MVEGNYGRDELTLYAKPQSRAVSMFIQSVIFPSLLATLMKSEDGELWTVVLDQLQTHTRSFEPLALYGEMERISSQQDMNQLFQVTCELQEVDFPLLTKIARSSFERLFATLQSLKSRPMLKPAA